MKTLKSTLVLVILLMFTPMLSNAQDMYRVHEDIVKPSHVMEYEGILAEMMAMVNKHQITDASWLCSVTSNSHYLYVSSIKNYADIDKPSFITQLIEKEGRDKIADLFNRMDKCYDTELDYIISLNKDLTYMPEGISQTQEGQNYRNYHILYVSPENRTIVKEKLKELKALNEAKKSKVYYRVYNSGFGTDGEYVMVAISAKDALDMEQTGKENDAIVGKESQDIINQMNFNCLRYEKLEANIRPDLGYTSK